MFELPGCGFSVLGLRSGQYEPLSRRFQFSRLTLQGSRAEFGSDDRERFGGMIAGLEVADAVRKRLSVHDNQ
jgi:hypothetical protein